MDERKDQLPICEFVFSSRCTDLSVLLPKSEFQHLHGLNITSVISKYRCLDWGPESILTFSGMWKSILRFVNIEINTLSPFSGMNRWLSTAKLVGSPSLWSTGTRLVSLRTDICVKILVDCTWLVSTSGDVLVDCTRLWLLVPFFIERLVIFLHVGASLVPKFPSLVDRDMLRIILVSDKVIRHGRQNGVIRWQLVY